MFDACEHAARAEGFKKLVLGATLPLCRGFGFREIERFMVTMPMGVLGSVGGGRCLASPADARDNASSITQEGADRDDA